VPLAKLVVVVASNAKEAVVATPVRLPTNVGAVTLPPKCPAPPTPIPPTIRRAPVIVDDAALDPLTNNCVSTVAVP
jgi:hypothetical protein